MTSNLSKNDYSRWTFEELQSECVKRGILPKRKNASQYIDMSGKGSEVQSFPPTKLKDKTGGGSL